MGIIDQLERRVSAGEVIVLDDAISTELQPRGVPNSYSTSLVSLEPAGLGGQVEKINRRAVEIALRARDATAERPVVVAGSMSPFCTLGSRAPPAGAGASSRGTARDRDFRDRRRVNTMTRFVALSGFLGAGKTTTLIAAAGLLERTGQRVAVVTNDQGSDLIDSTLARRNTSLAAEVTGGCFCCRFDDLMSVTRDLIESSAPDVIIAEAVGSCTDLQATVMRPLTEYYGEQFSVAPLTTVVDPLRMRAFHGAAESGEPESDLSYLFSRQLAEAEIIAVNKIDLIGEADAEAILAGLGQAYPGARSVPYSARTRTGLAELLQAWQPSTAWQGDLEVDYDRYAAAEAQLAWLNQRFDIHTAGSTGFDPIRWADAVLCKTAELTGVPELDIGHIKLSLDTDAGMFKASITGTTSGPAIDLLPDGLAQRGAAVINARVACEPAVLDSAVLGAISHADQLVGTSSRAHAAASFKPGYPKPVHRLTGPTGP